MKIIIIVILFVSFSSFSQSKSREFDIEILDKEKILPRSKSDDKIITKYIEFNIKSSNYINFNKKSLGIIIYNSKTILLQPRIWARGHSNKDISSNYQEPPYIGCSEVFFEQIDDNLIMKIPYQVVCYETIPSGSFMYSSRYFLKKGKYFVKIYYKFYNYYKNDMDTVYSNAIPLYVRKKFKP